MKKILFVAILLIQVVYSGEFYIGDPYKGQIYYKFFIAPQIGVNGAVSAKQFTKHEWREKFENSGKLFFEELNISKEGIDNQMLEHLEAFYIHYAKDSDFTPSCGD